MKVFQYLWRAWFLLVFLVTLVIFAPVLTLLALNKTLYKAFYFLGRIWALILCLGLGFVPKVEKRFTGKVPYPNIISGNHSSFLDVFLCYVLFKKPFKFIGKKELAKIPLFGMLYKQVAVLVDRTSRESRAEVIKESQKILGSGMGLAMFPEGGIPKVPTDLGQFKKGAFSLAAKTGLPIIPITFVDNKRKFPAYKMAGRPGIVKVVIHEPQYSNGKSEADVMELQERVYSIIKGDLVLQYESN